MRVEYPYRVSREEKLHGGQFKIDPTKYADIVSLYQEGATHKGIALRCGVNKKTIAGILKSKGVPFRGTKKFQVRDDWLSIVDTPEKAYFLGYFWADGNMQTNHKVCKITLQEKDAYILERFREWIYIGEKPLTPDFHDHFKFGPQRAKKYALSIPSRQFYDNLLKLGCVPAKSLTIGFPTFFKSSDMLWHFIRGSFDGDGCIHRLKSNGNFHVSWLGSSPFCSELYRFLISCGLHCSMVSKGKIFKVGIYSLADVKKLYPLLYSDSDGRRLERKHDLFLESLKKENKVRPISIHNRIDGNLVIVFKYMHECAKYLGCHVSTAHGYISGKHSHAKYLVTRSK